MENPMARLSQSEVHAEVTGINNSRAALPEGYELRAKKVPARAPREEAEGFAISSQQRKALAQMKRNGFLDRNRNSLVV
jgi:hypothetical protein